MANVLTNLDLKQNEIRNAVIQPLAVEPTNPRIGQIYYDTTTNKFMIFNGISWDVVGGGSGESINYSDVVGKPKINDVELSGNKTLAELGIQPKGDYALKTDIPTVPTKLSQFTNDSGYITDSALTPYAKANNVYTKGEVDNKVSEISTAKKDTITQSKATATYTVSGFITNVMVVENVSKEEVMCDLQFPNITTTNNQVKVTVSPYTSPLTVVISYI